MTNIAKITYLETQSNHKDAYHYTTGGTHWDDLTTHYIEAYTEYKDIYVIEIDGAYYKISNSYEINDKDKKNPPKWKNTNNSIRIEDDFSYLPINKTKHYYKDDIEKFIKRLKEKLEYKEELIKLRDREIIIDLSKRDEEEQEKKNEIVKEKIKTVIKMMNNIAEDKKITIEEVLNIISQEIKEQKEQKEQEQREKEENEKKQKEKINKIKSSIEKSITENDLDIYEIILALKDKYSDEFDDIFLEMSEENNWYEDEIEIFARK